MSRAPVPRGVIAALALLIMGAPLALMLWWMLEPEPAPAPTAPEHNAAPASNEDPAALTPPAPPANAGARHPGRITPDTPATLTVIARDTAGAPLAAAGLTITHTVGDRSETVPLGPGGSLTREVVAGAVRLRLAAPGYLDARAALTLNNGETTTWRVTLVHPARLVVRVTDGRGALADARVTAGSFAPDAVAVPVPATNPREAPGRYAAQLAPGDYVLRVRGPVHRPSVATVRLREAATTEITVALERGRTLVVRVQDAEGAPLAGAQVTARTLGPLALPPVNATSQASGEAMLGGVFPGPYVIQGERAGYLPAHTHVELAPTRPPGAVVNLTLARGRALRGVVRDPGGAPVSGATVELHVLRDATNDAVPRGVPSCSSCGTPEPRADAVTRTDARGRFAFATRVAPRAGFALIARHPRYRAAEFTQLAGAPPALPLLLTLGPASPITGRLVDATTGKPVARAEVVLTPFGTTSAVRTASGPDGRFAFPDIGQAPYALVVSALDYARYTGTLTEADRNQERIVALTPVPVVKGRVLAPDGTPVTSAALLAVPSGAFVIEKDGRGGFVLHRVPQGGGTLSVDAAGYRPRKQEVPAPRPGLRLDIVLDPGGELTGTVLGPDRQPLPGVYLYANYRDARDRRIYRKTRSGPDGRYRLPGLAGEVELFIRAVLHENRTETITVGDAIVTHDIVLGAGRTISGLVRTAAGAPVSGAALRVVEVAGERAGKEWYLGRAGLTSADGRFVLPGLPTGALRLDATSAWGQPATAEIPAGGAQVVSLVMEPGARLDATVLDPNGTPLPGATVVLSRPDLDPLDARQLRRQGLGQADGTLTIQGLVPGTYQVRVAQADAVPREQSLAIAPGRNEARFVLLPARHGVLVVKIRPDTFAFRAGLEVGDRLTDVAGKPVGSRTALSRRLAEAPEGKKTLGLIRQGSRLVLRVVPRDLAGATLRNAPSE